MGGSGTKGMETMRLGIQWIGAVKPAGGSGYELEGREQSPRSDPDSAPRALEACGAAVVPGAAAAGLTNVTGKSHAISGAGISIDSSHSTADAETTGDSPRPPGTYTLLLRSPSPPTHSGASRMNGPTPK